MPPAWNDDHHDDLELIGKNSERALRSVADHARGRGAPSAAMARAWHGLVFEGCAVPVPYYVGNFRDSDPECPHLIGYRVGVGSAEGTPPDEVPAAVDRFIASLITVVARLDEAIPQDGVPATIEELDGVLRLAAIAHGEWVRIHPFVNGNGRTARFWANWVLVRYGLRPAVRIKPRPIGTRYSVAAHHSMHADHLPMIDVIRSMLMDL